MNIRRWPQAASVLALAASLLFPAAPVIVPAAAPAVTATLLDTHGTHPHDAGVRGTMPRNPSTNSGDKTTASSNQETGLVLIETVLNYGDGQAAGTGLVFSPDGIVVTNHHVVAGSTRVIVTIAATGKFYDAEVLGYDSYEDVAVLQLLNSSGSKVSGLDTVTTNADPVTIGQRVTAVGNAQGGGKLVAAPGVVTGTGITITVENDDGSGTSDLFNLIQISSAMVPGDSGGALFNANNEVVGMNVAGSTKPDARESYCIPIQTVITIEQHVLAGEAASTIVIGRSAGLGVGVTTTTQAGVRVNEVMPGGPADKAGITNGSRLTSLDDTNITSPAQLAELLKQHASGDKVSIVWVDSGGTQHTVTVTLANAPLP